MGKLKLLFGNKYKKVTLINLAIFFISLILTKQLNFDDDKALEVAYTLMGLNIIFDPKYIYLFVATISLICIISGFLFLYFLFKKEQNEHELKNLQMMFEKISFEVKILEQQLQKLSLQNEINNIKR